MWCPFTRFVLAGRHIVAVQDCGGWKSFVMLAFVAVFGVFISLMFHLCHISPVSFRLTLSRNGIYMERCCRIINPHL